MYKNKIMIFFKDCSRRNLRSVSSSRLHKNIEKNPSVHKKFLYLGENPKKIENIIHRSITPDRAQTPVTGQTLVNKDVRPVSGFRPRKKKSAYLNAFKRKVFREENCGNKYFTNLFIEQLVSVPICERRSCHSIIRKSTPKIPTVDKIDLDKKFRRPMGTMTEVQVSEKERECKRLVIYCEPFTIEETESISSPIRPKYL